MTTARIYKKPPIVESVIEFQFQQAIDFGLVEKAAVRFKPEYSTLNETNNFNIHVDADKGQTSVQVQALGIRLANSSANRVLSVGTRGFTFSHLPIYPGWLAFRDAARELWRTWDRVTKSSNRISRVGLRYINRLDAPLSPSGAIETDDYLSIGLKVPQPPFPPLSQQSMRMAAKLPPDDLEFVLNFGMGDSPLLFHASIVIDIDVYSAVAIPRQEDELWVLLEKMHDHARALFEASINDSARSLIDG